MNSSPEKPAVNLTAEQQKRMKNFGKKNGLSAEKVQAHLEPDSSKQPISQQPTQQILKVAEKPPIGNNNPAQMEECDTYFRYEKENVGGLEIDLVTFREKGIETRYLYVLCSGLDVKQNPPIQQEAYLTIDSKENFERIKAFFAQLEWED
jgi:hypothetical protein